jgi:hypothetical protein
VAAVLEIDAGYDAVLKKRRPIILGRIRLPKNGGKKDVPMDKDFPLAPEEETTELRDLETTLQLRVVRALEHWKGNTHLTLAAIIARMVEETMWKREVKAGGTET